MKTCPKCGEPKTADLFHKNKSMSDGLSSWCKECNNSHYAKNATRILKVHSDRYWTDPEVARANKRATRDSVHHRETEAARGDRYLQRTEEEIAAHRSRLRPDGLKRCSKCGLWLLFEQYHAMRRAPDGLRRACKQCRSEAETKLSKIANFAARGLTSCVYCAGPFEHIDHFWPVARGGLDVESNLVPSCSNCNQRKSARQPFEWLNSERPGEDHHALVSSWGIVLEKV